MARTPKVRETPPPYAVDLAHRGRVVVPAAIREYLGVAEGDRLVFTPEADGSVRLRGLKAQISSLRGAFRDVASDRDLVAELIRERRQDAERE